MHKNILSAGQVVVRFGLSLILACFSLNARCADVAGTVKTVQGKVEIVRGSETIPATPGLAVYAEDKLQTGADSSVGVTLKDDTRISSGPNSTISLEKYAFNATTHDGNMLISVIKGTLAMVSGLLVKHSPESAAVKTPTATIGIRGTEFVVEVD